MANQTYSFNNEVTNFLDGLNHPFRAEIDELRKLILSTNADLSENIKWNGPNYSIGENDRITMRIQPPKKQTQLIFHRGAKKQAQPTDRLISSKSKLLQWKENDRAIITFQSATEIENGTTDLKEIIPEWINATK